MQSLVDIQWQQLYAMVKVLSADGSVTDANEHNRLIYDAEADEEKLSDESEGQLLKQRYMLTNFLSLHFSV